MNKKTTGIVAYFTVIGLLIAFIMGDREGAKFHLNQALVLELASLVNTYIVSKILGIIPFIGPLVSVVISLALFALWVLGLLAAIKEEEKEVPILGQIKILQ